MKNQNKRSLAGYIFPVLAFALTCMASCSDDPESTNEEEVITTVLITLTPEEGDAITLGWNDDNEDGIVDTEEIDDNKLLSINESYTATIELLNKSVTPEVDITEEIEEEAEDHLFCFEPTGANVSVAYADEDRNGLGIGLTSVWTTTTPSNGTIKITLRHQPDLKTGDCPGAGDTDVSLTFRISVGSES